MCLRFTKIFFVFCSIFCNCLFAQEQCPFQGNIQSIMPGTGVESFFLKLQSEKFFVSHDKKDIPAILMKQIECSLGDFMLANPNDYWNYSSNEFTSKLMMYAKSDGILALAYLHDDGTIGTHIWLIQYEIKKISVNGNNMYFKNIWFANGTRTSISTSDELVSAIHDLYEWSRKGMIRVQVSK